MKATAAIIALAAAAASSPAAAEGPAPQAAKSQYCLYAEDLYQKIIGAPMREERKTASTLITYSIYRNMAASRVVTLAWAGRCDMNPFLRMEMQHQKDASDSVTPLHEGSR